MDGRKRTVQIKFRVTEAERDLILEKMKLVPTRNMAAYLRKIAIDGYIIQIDHADIKAMTAEIQKIGVNVNQIARRVNATGNAYQEDIEEIKSIDPAAVILNGYYCGHLGEDMSLDELTAGVRYHYENSMNDIDGLIDGLQALLAAYDKLAEGEDKVGFQRKRAVVLGIVEVNIHRVHILGLPVNALARRRQAYHLPVKPLHKGKILCFRVADDNVVVRNEESVCHFPFGCKGFPASRRPQD